MSFQFEPRVMLETFPLLISGAKLTIFITFIGLLIGFILGTFFGLFKLSPSKLLRYLGGVYVEIIRGTPLIVQVMFLYFGLPMASGLRVPPLVAGIIAIAINSGAYIAEIVRGAVQSIDRGQMEAGRTIGLTKNQTMLYIIWPQALKRMIPPLGNQFIISLKDTSLLVVIGVAELTRVGQEIIAVNFRAFEVWLTVGLSYLVMTMAIAYVLRRIENRLSGSVGR
jgi:glutamine transport system permease protein